MLSPSEKQPLDVVERRAELTGVERPCVGSFDDLQAGTLDLAGDVLAVFQPVIPGAALVDHQGVGLDRGQD